MSKINISDSWKSITDETILVNNEYKDIISTYIKLDTNILNYSGWTQYSGDTLDGWDIYGGNHDGIWDYNPDPFGVETISYYSITDNTGNLFGGLYSPYAPCDHTEKYRFSMWTNREIVGTVGAFYFGFHTFNSSKTLISSVRLQDSAESSNRYFWNATYGTLGIVMPEDEYRLVVGYILPSDTTGTSSTFTGAVYQSGNTTAISSFNYQYKFKTDAAYMKLRTFAPYNDSDTSAKTLICYPRIDLCDGTEPSISTLVSNEGMWRTII